MRIAILIVVFLAWACGSPSPPETPRNVGGGADAAVPASRPDVTCGHLTCGPDEYCEVLCTCCGMRVPEPGEASASYSCKPLPDSCKTGDGPECQRTKNEPCA